MIKRLLLLATAIVVFAAAASTTLGDPPPITISVPSTVPASDPSGADVTYSVKSHLDPALDVNCTPEGGPGTDFSVTHHFPVGDNQPIHCSDGTNDADATVTVTPFQPADTTPPTVNVPGNITAEATGPSGAAVSFSASATDDTDPSPSVNCNPASGSTFAIGPTTVSCTATDASNNTSPAATFTVTVHDTTAPSLSLPSGITVPATSGAGATVNYSASASDAVSGSVPVTCNPPSGSTFPIGSTTVNCSATDGNSNTANGSFSVTVGDSGAPQFSNVPANITVEALGPGGSPVNYTPPTALDTVDGPSFVTCVPGSGATFPLGTSTVTCSATDAHSNTGTASFSVTVRDTIKPTLTIPANYTMYAETADGVSAQSHYPAMWLSQAHATDLVDPNPIVANDAPEFFTVGVHLVEFSASDHSGNADSKGATIEILPLPPAGTPPLPPPKPRATPPNVTALKAVAGDGRVRLTWNIPAGVDHVVVTRALTAGGDPQTVYTGPGKSFNDKGVANGLEYRYLVVSVAATGEESSGVGVVALPQRNLLRAPKDGARLKSPPKLMWTKNAEADYYNIQLYRGEVKILSTWPVGTSLKLKRTWKFEGRRYRLTKGVYRWYVWPGFGARSKVDYGDLLGSNSFQMTR